MAEFFNTIKNVITHRLFGLGVVFLLLMGVIIVRLFNLQIINGETYENKFYAKIEKKVSVEGIRGSIYDRNGEPLAKNDFAFSIILEDSVIIENMNEMLYKLITILNNNEDKIVHNIPLKLVDEEIIFDSNKSERTKEDFIAIIYNKNRRDLTDEEKEIEPEVLFKYIKDELFEINDEYSKTMILEIIALRFEVYKRRFNSYQPIQLAIDVSEASIAQIRERQNEFSGIVIETEPIRVYPYGEMFAHILGYTDNINSNELEQLSEQGYNQFDKVGKIGLELQMEKYLRGEDGFKTIEVDSKGRRQNVSSIKEPEKGDDIYLSIDKDLQVASYTILKEKIKELIINKVVLEKKEGKGPKQISLDDLFVALIENNFISIKSIEESNKTYHKKLYNLSLSEEEKTIVELKRLLLSEGVKIKFYNDNIKRFYDTYIQSMINRGILSVGYRNYTVFYPLYKNGEISAKQFMAFSLQENLFDLKYIYNLNEFDNIYNYLFGYGYIVKREDYHEKIVSEKELKKAIEKEYLDKKIDLRKIYSIEDYSASEITSLKENPYDVILTYDNMVKYLLKKGKINKNIKETELYQQYINEEISNQKFIKEAYKNNLVEDFSIEAENLSYKVDEEDALRILANDYIIYNFSLNYEDVYRGLMNQYILQTKELKDQQIISDMVDKTLDVLSNEKNFKNEVYESIIQEDKISDKEFIYILFEQELITNNNNERSKIENNIISPIELMKDKIRADEITPQNLALDPFSGSIVMSDVQTGEILSMVSYPSYDNNRMANGVDDAYFTNLINDKTSPMVFRATKGRSAPGSTYKMISAIAGLETGVITADEKIRDEGIFTKIKGVAPKCWIYSSYHATHGLTDVIKALEVSCNYFFYELAYRLTKIGHGDTPYDLSGISIIDEYSKKFGLGEKTGIEVEEYSPQIANKDAIRAAIGQSNHNYTPAQLTRYINAIANGGYLTDLNLVEKVVDSGGDVIAQTEHQREKIEGVSDNTLEIVQQGMKEVTSGDEGTVRKIFNDFSMEVAGKTGTAQENKVRDEHALFVGYAPFDQPQIAVTVVIPNGYSSNYAAEVFKEIVAKYFEINATNINVNSSIDTKFVY